MEGIALADIGSSENSPAKMQTPGSTSDPGALRDDCSSAPLDVSRRASPVAAASPNSTQGPARSDGCWLVATWAGCHGC